MYFVVKVEIQIHYRLIHMKKKTNFRYLCTSGQILSPSAKEPETVILIWLDIERFFISTFVTKYIITCSMDVSSFNFLFQNYKVCFFWWIYKFPTFSSYFHLKRTRNVIRSSCSSMMAAAHVLMKSVTYASSLGQSL